MQFNNIITFTIAALASTAVAIPKHNFAGNRTHAIMNAHNSTRPAQKTSSGSHIPQTNICTTLCSLQAQVCTIALPNNEDYCWDTYLDCDRLCDPTAIH